MRATAARPTRTLLAESTHAYRLRWKRRRLLLRFLRKRGQLKTVADRTAAIRTGAVLVFCCLRNEAERLPYFLDYYRKLGAAHFLFVDNDSNDGSAAILQDAADVSVWRTSAPYRQARFGMDWLGWLQMRYGHGHWCLTVDADELFLFPGVTDLALTGLTQSLEKQNRGSFGAVMLDMYPAGPVGDGAYAAGDDPLSVLPYFDPNGYSATWHPTYDNLWIQGGPRARMFFADVPAHAPTLNKVPLVKWNRRFSYVSSTHQMLPRRLHDVFGDDRRAVSTGVLLHTKFLPSIVAKSQEELLRKQHFENCANYANYYQSLIENPVLWHPGSQKYEGWQQLVRLGLMSEAADGITGKPDERSG